MIEIRQLIAVLKKSIQSETENPLAKIKLKLTAFQVNLNLIKFK